MEARIDWLPKQATQLMRPAGRNASCVDGFWVQIYPRLLSGKCTNAYIFLTKGLEQPWIEVPGHGRATHRKLYR